MHWVRVKNGFLRFPPIWKCIIIKGTQCRQKWWRFTITQEICLNVMLGSIEGLIKNERRCGCRGGVMSRIERSNENYKISNSSKMTKNRKRVDENDEKEGGNENDEFDEKLLSRRKWRKIARGSTKMTKFIHELKGRGQRKRRIDQNIDKSQEG